MNPITFSVTALDCPDPIALANFYADLTGLEVEPLGDFPPEDVDWIELQDNGLPTIGFQKVPRTFPPTGPTDRRPNSCTSTSRSPTSTRARPTRSRRREEGREPAGYQLRVYLDPAGHPFCLVKSES